MHDRLPTLKFTVHGLAVTLAGYNLSVLRAALFESLQKLAAIGVESVTVAQYQNNSPWCWVAFVYCDQWRQVVSTIDAADKDHAMTLASQALLLAEAFDRVAETLVL